MDIMIQGEIDGIETSEIIKTELDIPVIFLTAYADNMLVERAKSVEPFGYLLKPFTEQEIRAAIEIALYKKELERGLRRSEEKYRAIFESIQDIYYRTDMEGRITSVSPSVFPTLGYRPEELEGHPVKDLYKDPAAHDIFLKKLGESGSLSDYEIELVHKQGTTISASVSSHLVYGDGSRPAAVDGTVRDITRRKNAERERERLFKELQEALSKVKTLSGLLPICARCKKIRDDQGYWHQVEKYIHEHSEADFTHSICPECAEILYPRAFRKKKSKA